MPITHSPELLVLIAAALWGTSGIATQLAALPAAVIAFFRMAIPATVIGVYFFVRRHPLPREQIGIRLAASVLNAIRMFFFFVAYQYTSIANAVVALYTWPIFATIFARILLGERIGLRRAALLFVAFAGIPFLYLRAFIEASSGGHFIVSDDIVGISSMILSAALHSLAIVLLKRAKPGQSRFESTFFQNIVGAIVFLPIVIAMGPSISFVQLSISIYLGLVVGTFGFTLFFIGLHGTKTAAASNLAYFEVVVAIVLGALVLGQPVYWNTIVGGALIIVSILLSNRTVGDKPKIPLRR